MHRSPALPRATLPCPIVPRLVCPIAVGTFLVLISSTAATAQDPDLASTHQVHAVTADDPILHGLEIKATVDSEKNYVSLRGPQYYSMPSPALGEDPPRFLTWYAIRKPDVKEVQQIEVSDGFSNGKAFRVSVGQPAYFLMPTQTVTTGAPPDVPEDLNLFVAYRIANVDSLALPEPTPGRPSMICLPAEEWHHDEYIPIKSEARCLMVYEADAAGPASKVTVIDQFGINALTLDRQEFVYSEGELR